MKKISLLLCLFSGWIISAVPGGRPPEAEISNGLIHARIYLPDSVDGYYRGSRFDWSGVIASLDHRGHQYFGQWFQQYSPTLHDAILGPVEAFDPIGYQEAKKGETFLKIGIGILTRTDTLPYFFATQYPIVNSGTWKSTSQKDQVQFVHSLKDKGYSYEYEKTIKVLNNRSRMVITHTLKNTGTSALETMVYNHNFFVMDSQPTGPGFRVTFPFELPTEVVAEMKPFVQFKGHQLLFLKELGPKEHVFFRDLTAGKTSDYEIKIENHTTGAAVKITADQPIAKMVFWSASTTVCPEPYIKIKVEPGTEFKWNTTYEFYEVNSKRQK